MIRGLYQRKETLICELVSRKLCDERFNSYRAIIHMGEGRGANLRLSAKQILRKAAVGAAAGESNTRANK